MSHNPTRRGVVAGAGALGVGLAAPWIARAQSYKPEYKISTVVGAPFPWGLGAEKWAALVKERSGGKINMKVYPGAALVGGDQTKEFTAMRQGVIDMAVGSTINWSPQVAELNLFSLPFLMPDHKAIDAITGGEPGKKLFEIIAAKDVVPLAWGENGFRELSNSKREVRKPEDQKILRDAAVEAGAYNKELARKGITQADPSTLKEIEGLGVTISRLSDAEIKAFRDTTRPVYDKWKARIGNDLVASAEKAVSARSS